MMAAVRTPTAEPEQLPQEGDLRRLYRTERRSLVQLAWLLLHDQGDAEDMVQDAFVAAHLAWGRLRDTDKALPYLRSAVLNGARSKLRHLKVVERSAPRAAQSGESAEATVMAAEDRRQILAALHRLPHRQQECLVLRFYLDLSEAEIATTLGISKGSVKTHVHRGVATLAVRLEASP